MTSNYMVILSDGSKLNLGLGIKFEAKGIKVPGFSQKNGRFWEFSEPAVQLLVEYKVCSFESTWILWIKFSKSSNFR